MKEKFFLWNIALIKIRILGNVNGLELSFLLLPFFYTLVIQFEIVNLVNSTCSCLFPDSLAETQSHWIPILKSMTVEWEVNWHTLWIMLFILSESFERVYFKNSSVQICYYLLFCCWKTKTLKQFNVYIFQCLTRLYCTNVLFPKLRIGFLGSIHSAQIVADCNRWRSAKFGRRLYVLNAILFYNMWWTFTVGQDSDRPRRRSAPGK